jgi:hypothetical protein
MSSKKQEEAYNNGISKESEINEKNVKLDENSGTGKATGGNGDSRNKNYQSKSSSESNMMQKNYYIKGNSSDDTPFYYDQQIRDSRLTVTLHPNAKYSGGTWVPFPAGECFEKNVLANTGFLYRIKPIATAIALEDFLVNVTNSWTDFGKVNPLEEMFNSVKPYAGMLAKMSEYGVDKTISEYNYEDSDSTVVRSIGKVVGWAKKAAKAVGLTGGFDQLSDMLNRQLIVQGTRFAYYSGSTTSFGNLSMKFTIFSDWIQEGGTYRFVTCHEQLEELYDYSMYKLEGVNVNTGIGGSTGEAIDGFIGNQFKWQMPPGGFKADLKSIDNVQRGTLKLRINDMYTLENLVITSMNASFSKIPCKHPTEIGKIVPLYADVILSLQPVTMYSDAAMRAFVEGKSLDTVNSEKNDRKNSASGLFN